MAKNYNGTSIGIVYVGGLTTDGKESKDTRTPQQREALKELIREVDSAQMAEFGIRMRNDMKAFLVQQKQEQKSHKESSQIREVMIEKRDAVYLVNGTPVESGKKRTFREKMEDVICDIAKGAACIFLIYTVFIVILNRKKIEDFWYKIWKSRK